MRTLPSGPFNVIYADPPWRFARTQRPGWSISGNQVGKFSAMPIGQTEGHTAREVQL